MIALLDDLARAPGTSSSSARSETKGLRSMPTLVPDRAEARFATLAREHGWVHDFPWPDWQHRAEHYVQDPRHLARAGFGALRKLITTHVRKERFCEGRLRDMRERGHLRAILLRMRQLGLDSA
jgi:hypothetical protein